MDTQATKDLMAELHKNLSGKKLPKVEVRSRTATARNPAITRGVPFTLAAKRVECTVCHHGRCTQMVERGRSRCFCAPQSDGLARGLSSRPGKMEVHVDG